MADEPSTSLTPLAGLTHMLGSAVGALTPAAVKALSQLLGAAMDYPTALMKRETAKVNAQTKSIEVVEAAIAKVAAKVAAGDEEVVTRAMETLVNKQYRKQKNREAIAVEAVKLLADQTGQPATEPEGVPAPEVDDDWLNVFERYAEDATSERMQGLWSRVLAGEIRQPGRYAARTLRFLSEFSKEDAERFEHLSRFAMGDFAPVSAVRPNPGSDIRDLMALEAAGLLVGASSMGLTNNSKFNEQGFITFIESNIGLLLTGKPDMTVSIPIYSLTPLAQELLSLIPGRDIREAARNVANAIRSPLIQRASINVVLKMQSGMNTFMVLESLWSDESESPVEIGPIVDGNPS